VLPSAAVEPPRAARSSDSESSQQHADVSCVPPTHRLHRVILAKIARLLSANDRLSRSAELLVRRWHQLVNLSGADARLET
jgi:hypothetical protein